LKNGLKQITATAFPVYNSQLPYHLTVMEFTQVKASLTNRIFKAALQLKWLIAGFPLQWPGSGQVVDKVALGQVFSEYFGFRCQSSFHQMLHNHPHLSSGAGTTGQKWPQYKRLSPIPLAIRKKKNIQSINQQD
jgi:hypothetical protein